SSVTPAGSTETPVGSNAYRNPLDITLLNGALSLPVPTVSIPVGPSTGLLGQYAEAQSDGFSAGASGLITDTGGLVDLNDDPPVGGYPSSATLDLSDVADDVLPENTELDVDDFSSLGLDLGAVG